MARPVAIGHKDYAVTALVLQGGGALGAYQAGVYEGLAEANLHPNWVAGISIGALNAAIIAGNPPNQRADALSKFWNYICQQPFAPRLPSAQIAERDAALFTPFRPFLNSIEAARAMFEGQRGFFTPRVLQAFGYGGKGPADASYYDTSALRETLERFADFDRINDPREMRVSVGAVNVRTGNFIYFDNTERKLRPEHFMASGALPPGFPAVEVDGEFYWDGGLVSNTPLFYVLTEEPRQDALVFQIDLWSAAGKLPDTLSDVAVRQKDIQFSSRTRMITDEMHKRQHFRRLMSEVLDLVPEDQRQSPLYQEAAQMACDARRNIIHLIYKDKPYEGQSKDYEFGLLTMSEHWSSGLHDMRETLKHPEWLDMPDKGAHFVTHDLHRFEDQAG